MRSLKKIKGLKWKILDLVLMAILVILSIDMLYLYYSGAWYDPYKIIEISEIILLYALSILGVFRIILKLREFKRQLINS